MHTIDGGRSWQLGKISTGDEGLTADEALLSQDPVLYDVQFLDRRTGWVVGELGNIYHTTDGGRTWSSQQESLLGHGIFDVLDIPTFFGVHFIDANNGITAGLDGKIARTRDGGQNWQFEKLEAQVPFVDPLFQPFQFPDGTAWAVGAAGQVARQTSPGEPWKRASAGHGGAHLAARHRLHRQAERMDRRRLRADLAYHRRRQVVAAVGGLRPRRAVW